MNHAYEMKKMGGEVDYLFFMFDVYCYRALQTGLPVRYLGVHVIRVLGFKISKYLVQLGPCLLLVKYLADSYCPSTCKYLENLVFK